MPETPSLAASKDQSERARLIEALSELYNLLESYAPVWYTEAHREKVMAALRPVLEQGRTSL